MSCQAQNCTIRQTALGLSPAVLTLRAVITRRRCFRAARCLLRQGLIAISTLSRVQSCTTREAELGLPPAASTPHGLSIPRRCSPTGKRLLPAGLLAVRL